MVRASIVAAVLGAQLWAIVPFGSDVKEQYWPFVPYPMYDDAHRYGDRVVASTLEALPCGGGPPTVIGQASVAASSTKHFFGMLYRAAVPAGSADRARIAMYAQHVAPGRWCAFQIVHDSALIGPHGAVRLTAAPVIVARWRR